MAEDIILDCVDERMPKLQPWLLKYLGVGENYHLSSPIGGSLGFEDYYLGWLDFIVTNLGGVRLHCVDHLRCKGFQQVFGIGREHHLPTDIETRYHIEQFRLVNQRIEEYFGHRLETHYHLLTNVSENKIHEECVRISKELLVVVG